MNTKKIEVLEKAINMLENGFPYDWADYRYCNCGVILKAAGLDNNSMALQISGTYSNSVTEPYKEYCNMGRCSVTGMQFCKVQETFLKLGFNKDEIMDTERLGNVNVLSKMGAKSYTGLHGRPTIDDNKYSHRTTLITYLKTWVSILKEEQPAEPIIEPKEKIRRVYVVIDKEVKEQQINLS